MAEIGITASIIAVLQLSSKLISLSYPYISSAGDARTQISALRSELLELEAILLALQEAELNGDDENESAGDAAPLGKGLLAQWLEECKAEIQRLVDELEKPSRERQTLKRIAAKAAWPLKRQDVDRLVALVQRKKTGVGLGVGIENLKISSSVQKEVKKVSKTQSEDLKERVITWLKPASVSANYEASRVQCHDQTGEWFLKGTEYKEWKEKQHEFLWLHGIPGCGKTILVSTVIEDIRSIRKQSPDVAVAYFFFTFSDTGKQSPHQMLSTLAAQMLQQLSEIPNDIQDLYRMNSGNVMFASLLFELIRLLLGNFKKTYWILDALDEVAASDRTMLLSYLKSFLDEDDFQTMSLLFASRREWYLQEVFDEMPIVQCPIQNALVDADIERYVKTCLEDDPKLKRWSPDIRNEIQGALTQGANGMFRWVQCQLQAIKACRNANGIRKALIALPKTLDETYERVLLSISEDDFDFASNALLWIAFAERPMTIQEVAEAVIVEPGERSLDSNERLIDPNEILEICGSLVTVICERTGAEHIQLAHYSVKEYLVSDRMGAKELAKFALSLKNAQERITNVCLTYLSLDCFAAKRISDTVDGQRGRGERRSKDYPLLKYTSEQWFKHLVHIEDSDMRKQLEANAFQILSDEGALFENWVSEYEPFKLFVRDSIYGAAEYVGSSLYYFALIGLEDAVRTLIDRGSDVNLTGGGYVTALAAAVKGRHINVVRLLLQNGADPNIVGRNGHGYGKMRDQPTPLRIAVSNRDAEMADLLLQYKADVNLRHDNGNLLSNAIQHDDEAMVQKLLTNGAKLDNVSRYSESWTPIPLVAACERGNEKIVRLLLQNGADVNGATMFGGNALQVALSKDQDSIVEILLQHNADPCTVSRNSTALGVVASRGDVPFLKRLLSYCKNDQNSGRSGHRYLSDMSHELAEAALRGHIECVKILLEHGARPNGHFCIDSKRGEYRHVLDYACSGGQVEILQLLIDHGAKLDDVPPAPEETSPDVYHPSETHLTYQPRKGTLLQKACQASSAELVRFLLNRAPNDLARKMYAQLGLQGAATGKSTEVLDILIQAGANVNARFINGYTALQTAAGTYECHMVEPLLDRGADPDATEPEEEYIPGQYKRLICVKSFEEGRTALHITVRNNKTAARTLLQRGANPNAGPRHKKGSPLCAAANIADFDCQKDHSLLQCLLDHGADINAGGGAAPTPLMSSMEICQMWRTEKSNIHKAQLALIEFLLERGADPNQVATLTKGYDDIGACTPLGFARHWELKGVEKLLLKYGAKDC